MKHWRVPALLAGCGGFLVSAPRWAPPLPSGGWAAWGSWVQADPQRAVTLVAVWAAWLLVAWLFAVTALALLARSRRAVGRGASRIAALITPRAARGLLEALLGAALVVGPVSPAFAGTPALAPVPAPIVAPPELPPLLDLDRPDVSLPTPAPAAVPKSGPVGEPAPPNGVQTLRVRSGDTLWGLAAARLPAASSAAAITSAWQQWYAANRTEIGDDPGLLLVGETLVVPGPTP